MLQRIISTCSVCAVLDAAAWAQAPVGPEFRVNTYTNGRQSTSSLASDSSGNFVVAWTSDQDGSIWGVFGQRFSDAGLPVGAEFRVNTWTPQYQFDPSVASDPSGNFVVVWTSSHAQDGSDMGVFGQRFSATGTPVGGEFLVNTFTLSQQMSPSIASDPSGNFVVVWQSHGQDGSVRGVFGQRFSAAGAPLGGEFQINQSTIGDQQFPSVASDAGGNFVVTWLAPYVGVFGQRFSAAGAPLGGEFQVNTSTTGYWGRPSVASDVNGNFVVAWSNLDQDGSGYGAFGQRFSALGTPLGAEFRVNTFTAGHQFFTSVASDASGNFVVVWTSDGQDGSNHGVFGQRFSAAGAPQGAEFRVNAYTTNAQAFPSVAVQATGRFVVIWDSNGQDGSYWGVFGQRFGGLEPAAFAVDAPGLPTSNGNGVFEAGETVLVSPSWRNATGAARSFGGNAGSFTGPGTPGDPVYAVVDGSAGYGTVPDGATASCTSTGDCYVLGISVPTARPVQHWDASVREDITPAIHGQSKQWTLHVGESFADVPPASPFYRFVEALLHRGITGGCSAAQYCPGTPTTREQMAVFVLLAKEPPGYLPPACAPPNLFADVPETSGFCRWIEELSRRGVVSGCGGGNYCPSQPVTREQMAVFVLRALDPALVPPPCAPPNLFADVPETSGFCPWIEELANRAIVSGCGGGNYCPASAVSREQMGVFLGVTFGLALYGP